MNKWLSKETIEIQEIIGFFCETKKIVEYKQI